MTIQEILNTEYEEPKIFQFSDLSKEVTEEVVKILTSGLNEKDINDNISS